MSEVKASAGMVKLVQRYFDINKNKPPGYGKNWMRVLMAFGVVKEGHLGLTPMTIPEVKEREKRWGGWKRIRLELEEIEFNEAVAEAEEEEKEITEVLGEDWREDWNPETDPYPYKFPATPWEERLAKKRPHDTPFVGDHLTYRWRDILARMTCEWRELAESHPEGEREGYKSDDAKQLFSEIEQVNRGWRNPDDFPEIYGEWDDQHVTPEQHDEFKAIGEGRGVMSYGTCGYCGKQILDKGDNIKNHVAGCRLNPANGDKLSHIRYVSCVDPKSGYSVRVPGTRAGDDTMTFRYFVGWGQGQRTKRLTMMASYGKSGASHSNRMLGNVALTTKLGEYQADNLPSLINDRLPQPDVLSFSFNSDKSRFGVMIDTDNYPGGKISYSPSKDDDVYMRVEVEVIADKWEPMYLRRDVLSYAEKPLHVRIQIAPIGGSDKLASEWVYLLDEE